MVPEEARGPRVRFVTKRWSHHSTHSGYDRIIDYIGDPIERIDLTRLSSRWIPESVAMRFVGRAGVRGYSMTSFYDEWAAARNMIARPRRTVYHVLYGDDTYRYLGLVRRMTPHRLVVSYHLPPAALRDRMRHTQHLRRADAIVVVGTNLVPLFSELCGSDRVHYIPHGIDTDVFRPGTPPHGDSVGDAKPQVLVVGSHRRDFETLGAVIRKLQREAPEVQFVLVTGASIADSFRAHPNVEVKRHIEESELIRLYQEASVVLQPMEESTANNSILEGLACGVPIVATDVGGVGAYVNESCAVLTDAGDAEGMADAILRITRDPVRRSEMKHAAREQAMEFSWPRIASQFAALYDRIT